jgi:hypothetical protein
MGSGSSPGGPSGWDIWVRHDKPHPSKRQIADYDAVHDLSPSAATSLRDQESMYGRLVSLVMKGKERSCRPCCTGACADLLAARPRVERHVLEVCHAVESHC